MKVFANSDGAGAAMHSRPSFACWHAGERRKEVLYLLQVADSFWPPYFQIARRNGAASMLLYLRGVHRDRLACPLHYADLIASAAAVNQAARFG
jgi:hypothetical protein